MPQSNQEIAADITKTVCSIWLDKRYRTPEEFGRAVATIYALVFDAVKASDRA